MEHRKKLRRGGSIRSLVVLLCLFVSILCLLLLFSLSLPDISAKDKGKETHLQLVHETKSSDVELGELGKLMVEMLPNDLAFTVFTPSEQAFERVLNLRANESLAEDNLNDTFAILSRVMGFSTIARHLPSEVVPVLKESSFDSVSGYKLYAWKAANGTLFVNNVGSEWVDLMKGEIIVHVMSGVIMDPEFDQSFQNDDDED